MNTPVLTRRRFNLLASSAAALGGVSGLAGAVGAHSEEVSHLQVSRQVLEVNGKSAEVYGLTQADGTWGLYAKLHDRFRVRLVNQLDEATLIHWHGLTPPSEQDGVPGLSQPALRPGHAYDYDFVHNRAGTFWMHSHVGLQEQGLLAAPLIVRDPDDAARDEQEVVALLHDFTFRDPEEIFHTLRRGAGMSSMDGGGHGMEMSEDNGQAMAMSGEGAHGEPSQMGGEDHGGTAGEAGHGETMQMSAGDHGEMVHYNDIEFDAYLTNHRTLRDPEVVRVDPGGRVRLRIINGAAATNFLLDLGALEGELIAVDGNPVQPVRGHSFDLAIAQRVDIRLALPAGQGAFAVLARREDGVAQTGLVLATKSGQVSRIHERAHDKTRPLNLYLEHSLRALAPLARRPADRTHHLALTGRHAGYVWGLNEKVFDPDDPLIVAEGERVEVVMRNATAMPHPVHLHGHHFQVVAIDGARFDGAVRDTVLVPPKRSVTIAFDADNPGHWAFHCHQLYHMKAGMMTSVRYEGYRRAG